MKRKIIVTGATSFIAIALIRFLYANGDEVVAIIRPDSSRKSLLQKIFPGIFLFECNLEDLEKIKLPLTKYDILFHIGWTSDFCNSRFNLAGQLKNVHYCENAVKLAAKYECSAFLSVGSQAECGVVDIPINSFTKDNPMTAYAEAKCIAYDKTKRMCREYGISQYWPRLLSAYGPYDRNTTLIMSCISVCQKKSYLELTSAEQIWDYIYVDDVARALSAIVDRGIPGKKYSIASGVGKPLKEYVEKIAKIMKYPALMNGIGKKQYAENQVMYLVGDIKELIEDTGIEIEHTFEEGINSILK